MHVDPRTEWTEFDYALAEAYMLTETYRCPQCGGWRWECEERPNKGYKIHENDCYRLEAEAAYRYDQEKQMRTSKDEKAKQLRFAGVVLTAEPRLKKRSKPLMDKFFDKMAKEQDKHKTDEATLFMQDLMQAVQIEQLPHSLKDAYTPRQKSSDDI